MTSRTQQLTAELNRMLPILAADPSVSRVFLFGSLAAPESTSDWSDLDLCVIQSTPLRFLDRSAQWLRKLQPACGLDILVYTPAEFAAFAADVQSFVAREIQPKSRLLYAA
jgi:predicted nucleotidyltransferase